MQNLHHTFFFQAEDGIRDPEMSRGLGDVYKRQTKEHNIEKATILEQKLVTNEVVRSVLDIFPDSEVFFDDKKTNV